MRFKICTLIFIIFCFVACAIPIQHNDEWRNIQGTYVSYRILGDMMDTVELRVDSGYEVEGKYIWYVISPNHIYIESEYFFNHDPRMYVDPFVVSYDIACISVFYEGRLGYFVIPLIES